MQILFMLVTLLSASVSPPVQVDSCSFVKAGSFEHSVQIRFHNASSRTVRTVAFEVHNGPHHVVIRDSGSFSPNAKIDHRLATPTWELYHSQPHVCTVTYVEFQDGTTWRK